MLWKTQSALGLLILAAHPAAVADALPDNTLITICEDVQEWPPFTYLERDANGKRGKVLKGYSIDVLHAILDKAKVRFQVKLQSWARCLAEGKLGLRYQMLQNASLSKERARDYLISRPYYSLTSHYFYSKRRFPDGLKLDGLAELYQFKACGVWGFNYEHYGYPPGRIDQDAPNLHTVIKRLHLMSCDLFVEKIEVIEGFKIVGIDYFSDPDLASAPLPGIEPTPFHFMVPRSYPHAQALLKLLNTGISELEQTGRLQKIWHTHLAPR
ncbi:polar amino acid transport system substrate-binding protein [Chitinivorax tropicus]|uniref:Polar amino acid transport system substrate-binding protein n=1 Tax=Chitinivorax tropicus TaxID=714531 RepID=A0A840MV60_9PROT|nr:transporter substrate-binding domain-containing protein [Chitinivorax tropicus]MBB5020236.1 polar amino acid transport system substrate-binding protein [Chitinivorax tropicus]